MARRHNSLAYIVYSFRLPKLGCAMTPASNVRRSLNLVYSPILPVRDCFKSCCLNRFTRLGTRDVDSARGSYRVWFDYASRLLHETEAPK